MDASGQVWDPHAVPIGRLLGRTSKFVRLWADRELAPLGASVTEWILLFQIGHHPPPGPRQTDLARFSDMSEPALVRHLDRFEGDGLTSRTRDPADRRAVRVQLTPAGRDRLAELGAVVEKGDGQLRALLSDHEQLVLARALDALFQFALGEVTKEDPA